MYIEQFVFSKLKKDKKAICHHIFKYFIYFTRNPFFITTLTRVKSLKYLVNTKDIFEKNCLTCKFEFSSLFSCS